MLGTYSPSRHPWSTATLGKFEKLTLLDALKLHFQTFFALRFLHLTSMDLSGVNINSLTKFWIFVVIWWLVSIGKNISEKNTKTDIVLKMSAKVKGFKWIGPSITWNSLRWFSTCLSYLNGKYQIYFSLTSCKCRIFLGLAFS